MHFKGDDLAWLFSVVDDAQVVEFEIVHGNAVEVGGVKGEAYLIDGDVESVGIGGSRWGFCGLRDRKGMNAECGERHA